MSKGTAKATSQPTATEPESAQEPKLRPPNRCYGCAIACVTQILTFVAHLLPSAPVPVRQQLSQILDAILGCTMYQGDVRVRTGSRGVLCAMTKDDEETTNRVLARIKTKIQYGLDNHLIVDLATTVYNEVLLLKEVCAIDDKFWELRLKLGNFKKSSSNCTALHTFINLSITVLEIFFCTLKNLSNNPVVAEHIVLPLLRILVAICVPSLAQIKGICILSKDWRDILLT